MSVPTTIADLARLTNVDPRDINHYITGRANSGAINITVPAGRCIVITDIFQSEDTDRTQPRTITISSAGRTQDLAPNLDIAGEGEIMYVFSTGKVVATLVVTALAGKTVQTQIGWYELPDSALAVLQQCGTRQVNQ